MPALLCRNSSRRVRIQPGSPCPDGPPYGPSGVVFPPSASSSLAEAKSKGLALDFGIEAVCPEAAAAGEPRECTRWTACRADAGPCGFLAIRWRRASGVWTDDVTMPISWPRAWSASPPPMTYLEPVGDAVAVFRTRPPAGVPTTPPSPPCGDWSPAWVAEQPTHARTARPPAPAAPPARDRRLRQVQAEELSRYEQLSDSPEALWRLPATARSRSSSAPPQGGLVWSFPTSPELRLKTQFKPPDPGPQATLDKAHRRRPVFGSDGRLKTPQRKLSRPSGV